MLPLSDDIPRRLTPVVNYLLIAVNVLMFMWEISLGYDLEPALRIVAFVPARFWGSPHIVVDFGRLLVSLFLHGGWLHLGGNMLYLWVFGDNIEDRLGHVRYAIFYILCGVLATLAHAFVNPMSVVPSIGASGAIAGVLGAYLLLYPSARVTTVIPIFMFITVRQIPAIFVLGIWFVLQFFSGVASLGIPEVQSQGGVAYFAHIGGFVAGMILIVLFGGTRRRQTYSEYWR
jgi:membrane associated rhomboid family serine protease